MTGEQKPGGLEVVARHHAERLLDNIACATQNRALLTGDPAEDKVLTEAVIENVVQEFEAAIRDLEARIDYLRTSRDGHAAESHKQFLRATAAEAKLARAVEVFGVITDLSVNLRRGGPDSSDLNDLSDALETAVSVAAEALAALKSEGK